MNTADRSKGPARLGELTELLRPYADDLLLHDPDGHAECVVRAGQLLAHTGSVGLLTERLGARVDRVDPHLAGGVARIRLRPSHRAQPVELAAELASSPDTPDVQPNHVHFAGTTMSGTPIEFGTGARPRQAAMPPAPPDELWDPPVTVALLDSGLDPHPWFAARPWLSAWGLSPEVLHPDQPAVRDRQAGHGTFVAGVLLRHAPGVTVRHHRTLSSLGITDDAIVAAGLARVRAMAEARGERLDIVVLTAGCHTADDRCPPVLRRAIERHGDALVIASAGNNGATRPFWPAALPEVIAVAATGPDGALATFSNRGDWVDTAAPGVDVVSSFVRSVPDDSGIAPGTATRMYCAARWSGTSFAAPRVAADLAQLLRSGLTPAAARDQLRHSFGR